VIVLCVQSATGIHVVPGASRSSVVEAAWAVEGLLHCCMAMLNAGQIAPEKLRAAMYVR
jgi:hypothetical protein